MEVWKKDAETLSEVLPKDVLSSTYGGNEPPMEELKGNMPFQFEKFFLYIFVFSYPPP